MRRSLEGANIVGRRPPVPLPRLSAIARAARVAAPAGAALILGLVDAQRTAVDLAAVGRTDHGGDIVDLHLHEAKAARAAGVAVGDHTSALDLTKAAEDFLELRVADAPGQISDE